MHTALHATATRLVGTCVALLFFALSAPAWAVPDPYPTAGTEAPASVFTAGSSGVLAGYFTGAAGSLTNLAGVQINGVDGAVGLNNQASAYGDRFVFGNVSAGDALVFFILVTDNGGRFYSTPSLNADGVNHTWSKAYAGDALVPAGLNLAFEDLPNGGDLNYFDHSFVFTITAAPVPEPSPALLLLIGLCTAGAWVQRRQMGPGAH